MNLSESQQIKIQNYINSNKLIFANPVVQSFYQQTQNIELLLKVLDGSEEDSGKLEERFRKHFFNMRFLKFLVSTIKFCTIDHIRSHQKYDSRNQLIFDRPVSEEGDALLGDILLDKNNLSIAQPTISNPEEFQMSFSDERLIIAFSLLSKKQQLITTLRYGLCYQDNEIAKMLGVSAQAVSKTRSLALHKLRHAMQERRQPNG